MHRFDKLAPMALDVTLTDIVARLRQGRFQTGRAFWKPGPLKSQ